MDLKSALRLMCFLGMQHYILSANQNGIKLADNAYTGIVIAIHKDVPHNEKLLTNLKDYFIEASDRLMKATRRRAYFKEITILVPLTWPPSDQYETAHGETYENSMIRVEKSNPVFGDNPYVLQNAGCGMPGEYMHLTPSYLLDKENTYYRWGDPAKSIVHEWGHLRWGLFDEYAKDKNADKHFYSVGKQILPVRCNSEIQGKPLNIITQGRCKIDFDTLQVEKDCRFIPDTESTESKASIMFMQYLNSVTDFCDDGTLNDDGIIHNKDAPNSQNRFCSGKSAWEIMRQHEDFKNDANPPNTNLDGTKTNFRLVQATNQRTVLVLDVSGSMMDTSNEARLTRLRQAVRNYISNTAEVGSQLGIVEFSNDAMVKQELLTVSDSAARQAMLANIPNHDDVSGETCIGCGLYQAVNLLKKVDKTIQCDGHIVLVTDGKQNRYPSKVNNVSIGVPVESSNAEEEYFNKIQSQCRLVVDIIAISESSFEDKLQDMSDATGGRLFFYDQDTSTTTLFDAFDAIAMDRGSRSAAHLPITVDSLKVVVNDSMAIVGNFVIDATIGNGTVMTFSYDDKVTVKVTRPDGAVIDQTSANYQCDDAFKTITVSIHKAAEGIWKYEITRQTKGKSTVMVNIVSRPLGGDPIIVKTSRPTVSKSGGEKVSAFVTRGNTAPIIGARVDVVMGRPTKGTTSFQLLDNGSGVDLHMDDGIYSGTVPMKAITSDGTYSMKIFVRDRNDGTTYVPKLTHRQGAAGFPLNNTDISSEKEETGEFQRVMNAGMLSLGGSTPDLPDYVPPSKIMDLEVTQAIPEKSAFRLQWTAVGDDVDRGTVAYNEVFLFTNLSLYQDQIQPDVTALIKATKSMILEGNLYDPKPAGGNENILVAASRAILDESNGTFYVAVRSVDAAANVLSYLSNYVVVSVENPELGSEFDLLKTDNKLHEGTNVGAIVGGVIGGLLAIGIIIILILLFMSRRANGDLWNTVSGSFAKLV